MNIHLQYALTLEDFTQFQRAYLRSRRQMERRITYGFSSSRLLFWLIMVAFVETKDTFILFASVRTAHILPKRAFATEEELSAFRNFALAHVGSKPIGFPVLSAAAATQQAQFP